MAEPVPEGPAVPPPGQRSGTGSASLLPYLRRPAPASLKDSPSPRDEPAGAERTDDERGS